ncbi:MAG: Ldh family oxidoreductase, partial [Anaerolineales bacterium]|nr:Ldh family oxidoreductase [Anaerolineales bacterium]
MTENKFNSVIINTEVLTGYCTRVFMALGLLETDAVLSARVLVAANVRGIPSHGVGRLWRYVNGIESGLIQTDAPVVALMETPTSLVVNANGTMGAPVSIRTMERLIVKAESHGAAF